MDQGHDPVVQQYRQRISDADLQIVQLVNRRIELVAELHAYKTEQGYPRIDHAREQALLTKLAATNDGPLSEEGLFELVTAILDLTKREIARRAAPTLQAGS
jgi:3-deoxy-7-phosphoheptulonate synthase / chorismate mutase